MSLSALVFKQQFLRFKELVRARSDGESFVSFADGLPFQQEGYKSDIRREALRILDFAKWRPSHVGTGRLLKAVIQAIQIDDRQLGLRNNLVRWQNRFGPKSRSHQALIEALDDRPACKSLEQWLLDFYQGRLAAAEAFERLGELAGNRYDLLAYLFFLKNAECFMPISPTYFDTAFRMLEIDLTTSHRCSWENYQDYNAALTDVQEALLTIGRVPGVRLIDAHSFCWMLAWARLKLPDPTALPEIPLPVEVRIHESAGLPQATTADGEFATVTDEQFAARDAERRRLGKLAQDVALRSEQNRLREAGHPDPERAVIAVWNEPARGYDIQSCELDGRPRYIEVKSARRSGEVLSFIISQNEWTKSRSMNNYLLYLVLEADSPQPEVRFVDAQKLSQDHLKPMSYFARVVMGGT